MLPSLAVVLATRNRPDALAQVLKDLIGQSEDVAELWVVDQSDGPFALRTRTNVSACPGWHYVHLRKANLPAARNEGVRRVSSDLVLFLDDDVRVHPGCLRAHREAFASDPRLGGASGRILEAVVKPNAAHTTNRLALNGRIRTRLDGTRPTTLRSLKGAHMCYRRQALEEAGPADERLVGTAFLEDTDWSMRVRRAGWRLRFLPDAVVEHLSLPMGGVRTQDPVRDHEWWRFHHTAYVVRKLRPWSLPLAAATFGAIGVKKGLQDRSVKRAVSLWSAFARGLGED